jgi:hypothetical protein
MKETTGTRILRAVHDQLSRPDCIQGESNFNGMWPLRRGEYGYGTDMSLLQAVEQVVRRKEGSDLEICEVGLASVGLPK